MGSVIIRTTEFIITFMMWRRMSLFKRDQIRNWFMVIRIDKGIGIIKKEGKCFVSSLTQKLKFSIRVHTTGMT
jgi:hypothetical protein